jgi:hypothetical protein
LVNCQPSNHCELWGKFKQNLYEDIKYNHPNADEQALENTALLFISRNLAKYGKKLSDFPELPELVLNANIIDQLNNNILVDDELTYDCTSLKEKLKNDEMKLNVDQKFAFESIKRAINENDQSII